MKRYIDKDDLIAELRQEQKWIDDVIKDADHRFQRINEVARVIMLICNMDCENAEESELIGDPIKSVCSGCTYEKHGNIRCENCSRMYTDRYEKRIEEQQENKMKGRTDG